MKYLLFTISILLLASCGKEPEEVMTMARPTLPSVPYNYANQQLPQHLQFMAITNPDNPTTDEGATLGRVLFYDKKLSVNNTIACASCHAQGAGFCDPNQFSRGFNFEMTTRNSPASVNMAFDQGFFWDVRASTLEELATMPIQNHVEMGMEKLDVLATKLASIDYYPALFQDAFGTSDVSEERIANAIAQFLRSCMSYNSKFDQGYATNFSNFTALELQGKELFEQVFHCAQCHTQPLFKPTWGPLTANIGLEMEYTDQGLAEWSPGAFNEGQFKIPSLRNIELTGPYMHDGRFETLEEVLDHYSTGVVDHPALDWRLSTFGAGPAKLNITAAQKQALIAFMKTLTDHNLAVDPKFSDPFK